MRCKLPHNMAHTLPPWLRSYNCLFETFPENNSSSHHKTVTNSGLFIVHEASKIGITKANYIMNVGLPIYEHKILSTLKISQNFLSHSPMASTKITQVSNQHTNCKSNIWACAYLIIHQAAYHRWIWDHFHLTPFFIILRTLSLWKFVTFTIEALLGAEQCTLNLFKTLSI